jgi:predicted amidohydrolase YtcJ
MGATAGTHEAVAIAGDRIASVGTHAEARDRLGPAARTIDLGGATVLPGFIDAHNHLILLGHWLGQVDLPRPSGPWRIVDATRRGTHRARHTWIEARG